MDAFSLLCSKLLLAKLSLFVVGANFAEWRWSIGNLLAYIAAFFVTIVCNLGLKYTFLWANFG